MKEDIEIAIVSKVIDALAKKRKDLGLSHQQLAERANLDRSAISLIESKKRIPTLLTALKISRAMQLNLSDLLKEYEG
jgi:transcriptional regulator with XRE-family HTH domain